jgi:hypothetical protein
LCALLPTKVFSFSREKLEKEYEFFLDVTASFIRDYLAGVGGSYHP